MPRKSVKTINLALQGGGSHGAFAWGVLNRLLEDERIEIEAVCATSAGTMNACAMAYGLYTNGREGALATLNTFWERISKGHGFFGPFNFASWQSPFNLANLPQARFWFDSITHMVSPYQTNPFDINPLKDVLDDVIDFEALRKCDCIKIFISTTNVETGKVRVFTAPELSVDVALASACLPFLFKAVEIEDKHYWDGGYMGNPALFPLFYESKARDVMIVHLNPIVREGVPKTPGEIMDRLNEITFNASLLQEMRAIAFVKKLVENDMLKQSYHSRFKDMLVHSIRADEAMKGYSSTSKFDTSWPFLTELRDKGYAAMSAWLDEHFSALGKRDTVDLHEEFLTSIGTIFEREDGAR